MFVLEKALQKNLIETEDTSIIFYDLTLLAENIKQLIALFPNTSLHTIAIKANPLTKILKIIQSFNIGLEAASLPELYLAQQANIPAPKILFDSPCKTKTELEYALSHNIHINADSFAELERIDTILNYKKSNSRIGLRINPQVGAGKIAITSVAEQYSKFGVAINAYYQEIIQAFQKYSWLTGLHVHIGSQGGDSSLLINGIKKTYGLINEIEKEIDFFDIGGGLSVQYHPQDKIDNLETYVKLLQQHIPELFNNKLQIITEFGRAIHANTGWVASKVEYVKEEKNIKTAMIHIGADLLLRHCYNPQDWYHKISVYNHKGQLKQGTDTKKYTIAGPLCFAGDIIAKEITLPPIQEGDYIIIHDIGAYTLSMWSRYNSRQVPKVLGYYQQGEQFLLLKERESVEKVWEFWG